MTSLLGRMLRLFPESIPLEDLFTEAVARLFERRPELCIAWLQEQNLLRRALAATPGEAYVRVSSQRPFEPLDHHDTASRPDLLIEVYWPTREDPEDDDAVADVVMVESKIGSGEGQDQLRRYAEHLAGMTGFDGKTLLYVTRAYDPKDPKEILAASGGTVRFKQLRWHDFYRYLQTAEKDALVEEVMTFMEEQGMAKSFRFSTTDLATLSGMPRAFEILEETLGGEVKAELETFAGSRSRHETVNAMLRANVRYVLLAPLHGWDFFCYVGYRLRTSDGYPLAYVNLQTLPGAAGRETSVAAMKGLADLDGWEVFNLDKPKSLAGARRTMSLATVLREDDHVAAVQRFFVESIRQLRKEFTSFKKEHPDLSWTGK